MATQSVQPDSPAGSSAVPPPTSAAPRITPDDVARRAYELYESRGRADGDALADWLRAEGELTARRES